MGAGVSYADFLEVVREHLPQLKDYLLRIGGAQVRAAGTLGGNIANGSPIGDIPPALIPLEALITLRSAQSRRNLPLADFFIEYGKQDLSPGEFVETVSFKTPKAGQLYKAHKLSKRRNEDISTVAGGFLIEREGGVVTKARFAYGGMAGTPQRAVAAETALLGRSWDEAAVKEAMTAITADFTPLSDARASADYRMLSAQNMLLRFFHESEASL